MFQQYTLWKRFRLDSVMKCQSNQICLIMRICRSLAHIFDSSYLTDLRSKKQHPPGVNVMSVTIQVANEAAVGEVLHHQTHTEATCERAIIKIIQQKENLFKLRRCSTSSLIFLESVDQCPLKTQIIQGRSCNTHSELLRAHCRKHTYSWPPYKAEVKQTGTKELWVIALHVNIALIFITGVEPDLLALKLCVISSRTISPTPSTMSFLIT